MKPSLLKKLMKIISNQGRDSTDEPQFAAGKPFVPREFNNPPNLPAAKPKF